jgi:hypothetical protein
MEFIAPILFAAFFGYVLWTLFSRKGRGKALGGEIVWSGPEKKVGGTSLSKEVVTVHLIRTSNPSDPFSIGVEYRATALMAASTTPIKLTTEQAGELARDIDKALEQRHHPGELK